MINYEPCAVMSKVLYESFSIWVEFWKFNACMIFTKQCIRNLDLKSMYVEIGLCSIAQSVSYLTW